MKQLSARTFFRKGFTLIELLIVIAILGVLAAALIATVDPFEQIKRSRDSRVRELTTQFLEANIRYYTAHSSFPWQAAAGTNCYAQNVLSAVPLSGLSTCITTLTSEGELKQSFTSSTDLTSVTANNTLNSSDLIVCFQPQSKSQQKDVNTKYNSNGTLGTACKSQGGGTDCYWCAQ